ncbi:MAG TPA: ribulose phosphate epimerase [Nannocystis sp.]
MIKHIQRSLIGAALALSGCSDDGKSPQTTAATQSGGPTSASGDPSTSDSDGSTSTPTSSTTSETTVAPTTGVHTSGTTEVDPTATTSGSTGDCQGFICQTDQGGGDIECDVWTQDCPPGQKCMPWANDGGGSWNATKCSPVDANPGQEGDPCTVEGSAVSGVDSCDVGLLCWYFDENNNGTCIDMCKGSPDNPTCDMGQLCDISNDGVLILCLNTCDPLVVDCPPGQICFPAQTGTDFICDFDASGDGGMYGDPCAYINVCDPGLFCAVPEAVPGCESGDGCCTPYCDLTLPNNCPGKDQGQECVPWYPPGMAPPGQEKIGACAVPE